MDNLKSRSLTFYNGKKKQIVFTAYANRSYFISICSSKKIKNLQLRLYESDTSNVIIYDNAAYEFKPTLTIDTDKTKKLKIEILLPPDPIPSKRKEYVCIGLLTGYKKL